MDARNYNIRKYKYQNVDEIIQKNYSISYMNNSKWVKMIDNLTDRFDEVFVNYKLVYDDIIENYIFMYISNFKSFFKEPIGYKEVEWVEFPDKYENWVNRSNLKAGKKLYDQNIVEIENELKKIGEFNIEKFDNSIRLIAYK